MSSPCWSLPHLLSHSLPQHEAPLGQHDLLQEHSAHPAQLPHHYLLREPQAHSAQPQTITRSERIATRPLCDNATQDTKERAANGVLHTLDLFGDEAEEEYDDVSKPRSTLQKQLEYSSGRSLFGLIWERRKRKDYNSDRHGLMPFSFMTHGQLAASKKWYASDDTQFCIKRFLRHDQLRNRVEERMAGGARHTMKQRAIVCGGRPLQN